MSKGLEQFNKLKTWYILKMVEGNELLLRNNEKEMLDIIEKELKDYEYWSSFVKCYGDVKAEDLQRFIHNGWVYDIKGYKKDEALEIIKKKRVNVDNFLNHIKKDTDYKEYKRLCGLYKIMVFSEELLTEEEYDLLKEVLL